MLEKSCQLLLPLEEVGAFSGPSLDSLFSVLTASVSTSTSLVSWPLMTCKRPARASCEERSSSSRGSRRALSPRLDARPTDLEHIRRSMRGPWSSRCAIHPRISGGRASKAVTRSPEVPDMEFKPTNTKIYNAAITTKITVKQLSAAQVRSTYCRVFVLPGDT